MRQNGARRVRSLTLDAWSDMFGSQPRTAIWCGDRLLDEASLEKRLEFQIPEDTNTVKVSVGTATSVDLDIPQKDEIRIKIEELPRDIYSRTNDGLGLERLFFWPYHGLQDADTGDSGIGILFLWIAVLILMPIIGALTIMIFVPFRFFTGRDWRSGERKNWSNQTLVARLVAEE